MQQYIHRHKKKTIQIYYIKSKPLLQRSVIFYRFLISAKLQHHININNCIAYERHYRFLYNL